MNFDMYDLIESVIIVNGNRISSGEVSVYFTESRKKSILDLATYDVHRLQDYEFQATFAVIIHYKAERCSNCSLLHSQVVLASNGTITYGIFNFIGSNGNDTFYRETSCNERQLSELNITATVNSDKRYVVKLTSEREIKDCPPNLECNIDQSDNSFCDCKKKCYGNVNYVCGTDNISYESECDMDRIFCEKHGTSFRNVSIAYFGKCQGIDSFSVQVTAIMRNIIWNQPFMHNKCLRYEIMSRAI